MDSIGRRGFVVGDAGFSPVSSVMQRCRKPVAAREWSVGCIFVCLVGEGAFRALKRACHFGNHGASRIGIQCVTTAMLVYRPRTRERAITDSKTGRGVREGARGDFITIS